MAISPYCARDTIGGTSVLPRTVVGEGATLGDDDRVADGLTVGVGLALAGAVHAVTASEAVTRRTAAFIAANVLARGKLSAPDVTVPCPMSRVGFVVNELASHLADRSPLEGPVRVTTDPSSEIV
jgi:hypothetical protein